MRFVHSGDVSRLQGLLSTTALVLALVGQGTALVHMGVVRHERCAEHGELVDVGAAGVARAADTAAVDASGSHERTVDVTAAVGSEEAADHAGDDHCVIAFSISNVPAVDGGVAEVDADVVVIAALTDGLLPSDGVVVRAILDVAPKTSPPTT